MSDQVQLEVVTGGPELLDRIEPLWQGLREHHAAIAPTWAGELRGKSFDQRKWELLARGNAAILVLIAIADGTDCAYCVGTIDQKGDGEIVSLFVDEPCRGRGIGSALVRQAMQWFAAHGVASVGVELIAGNDQAARFYERAGFESRSVRMVRRKVQ